MAPLTEGQSHHSERVLTVKGASGLPEADTVSGKLIRATLICFYNNRTEQWTPLIVPLFCPLRGFGGVGSAGYATVDHYRWV